jgi:hypothetical protein
MDGLFYSLSFFVVLTLLPAKMFVQKKLRGELARNLVWPMAKAAIRPVPVF